MNWPMFTFKGSQRALCTLNTGMILSLIVFNDAGYPTPSNKQNVINHITPLMDCLYGVARYSSDYYNFAMKFVTEIYLITGKDMIYVIPLEDLIGPLCGVANIYSI